MASKLKKNSKEDSVDSATENNDVEEEEKNDSNRITSKNLDSHFLSRNYPPKKAKEEVEVEKEEDSHEEDTPKRKMRTKLQTIDETKHEISGFTS